MRGLDIVWGASVCAELIWVLSIGGHFVMVTREFDREKVSCPLPIYKHFTFVQPISLLLQLFLNWVELGAKKFESLSIHLMAAGKWLSMNTFFLFLLLVVTLMFFLVCLSLRGSHWGLKRGIDLGVWAVLALQRVEETDIDGVSLGKATQIICIVDGRINENLSPWALIFAISPSCKSLRENLSFWRFFRIQDCVFDANAMRYDLQTMVYAIPTTHRWRINRLVCELIQDLIILAATWDSSYWTTDAT